MSRKPEYLPEHHEAMDEWHAHSAREPRPQSEHAGHVNTTALGIAFLAIASSIVLVIVLVVVYFSSYAAEARARRVETTTWAVEAIDEKQNEKVLLDTGGVTEAGVTFTPIGEAIETVVQNYAQRGSDAD